MKRNAIARIIIFSVIALVLTSFLVIGIAPEFLMGQFAIGDNVPREGHAPGDIRRLEIDWAAGKITIRKKDNIDGIFFYEMGPDGCWYHMDYEYDEYTLQISYGAKFTIGKSVEKDLTIEVPANWTCDELELNAAGVIVNIEDVDMHTLELNGADCKLNYSGDVTYLDINSTGAELSVSCAGRPQQVDLNGMGCKLNLQLPAECGFSLNTSGLGCELDTSLPISEKNGKKVYGDEACAIEVNGLGCSITITENDEYMHNHEHLWEDISDVAEHPNYICSICGIAKLEPKPELTIHDPATVISGFMGLVGIRANGSIIQHSPAGENPVPEIESWTNMRSLASGNSHIVGLRSDGTVVAAGDNSYGQCNVSGWTDVVSIDCGTYFTVGLKADGTVLHTGAAPHGVDKAKNWVGIVQLEAAGERVLGRRIDGSAVALGDQNNEMCQVPTGCDIIDIYLDAERAVYLHSNGKIEIKGNRLYVEDQTISSLTTVETDGIYLAGLKEDGSMYFEGYNADLTNKGQIVAIVDYCLHKLGLRSDGTLVIICKYGGTAAEIPAWARLMVP